MTTSRTKTLKSVAKKRATATVKASKKSQLRLTTKKAAKPLAKTGLKRLRLIGLMLVLIGLAGILPPFYYKYRDNQVRAQAARISTSPQFQLPDRPSVISGKPSELYIPSLDMHLEVVDGAYDPETGEWTLSLDKAHYALPTVVPNNYEGNTLIYGHYRPEVFAYLHNIEKGASAEVTTANGYRFYYTFQDSKATSPSDVSIFSYRGTPMLTLQTCSGAYMQNRQLFSFTFTKVEKI